MAKAGLPEPQSPEGENSTLAGNAPETGAGPCGVIFSCALQSSGAQERCPAAFLRETLRPELNDAKTLITHARSQRARFLGYDITVQHCDTRLTGGRRTANGKIALKVPPDVYRLNTLWRYSTTSMLKTLAAKHHSTVSKMAARHKAKVEIRNGLRTCFEARRKRQGNKDLVARSGGIILQRDRHAEIREPRPAPAACPRKELTSRLRTRECELCQTGTTVAVHQVTGLRAPGQPGPGQPAWAALMAKKRRKTLIVCAACHDLIHATPVTHAA